MQTSLTENTSKWFVLLIQPDQPIFPRKNNSYFFSNIVGYQNFNVCGILKMRAMSVLREFQLPK